MLANAAFAQVLMTFLILAKLERLYTILKSVRNIIIQFNLFKRANEIQERQIHHQRIATRVYIALIIIILSVLTFYTSLNKQTFTETILKPSELAYLQLESLYPSSLRCQCSQMSIDYDVILSIQPIFHPICSSDLVSSAWMELLRENYRPPPFGYADLLSMSGGMFQLLATFCEIVNKTVYDSLDTFLRRQIVTAEVLSKDLFTSQLSTAIDKWQAGVTYDFLQTVYLFQANMQGNMLLSNEYNFRWHAIPPGRVYVYFNGYLLDFPSIDLCSCALSVYCSETLSVFDDELNKLIIDGLILACTPITSLILSDFRVFYNQSFIDELFTFIPLNSKNFSFHPLMASDANQINDRIQSIAERSFVNQWIEELSFTDYYKTCAPQSCTYQVVRHPHPIWILTTMIAVFGGLSTLLEILMEIILLALSKFQGRPSRQAMQRWLMGFNDRVHLSKRLNIVLISVALVGMYFSYAFSKYQQVSELTRDPSFKFYLNLIDTYPNESLYCPCSQASIPYNSFINISVTHYHQVCTKEFLTYEWLNTYLPNLVVVVQDPSSFSSIIPIYFQLIAEFCQAAQRTVNTSLLEFLGTSLIETSPNSSPEIFRALMESRIEQFKMDLSQSMIGTLELLRETTHINQLLTIFRSNWRFVQINPATNPVYSGGGYIAAMTPVLYHGCDCGLSKYCTKLMTDSNDATISGLMVGCYPLEALLQSSLECFYDDTCFRMMISPSYRFIDTSSLLLSTSIPSRYDPTTKIDEILKSAFIEEWSVNISYEEYYKVCAPSSCSYSYLESTSSVEIVTNLLGLHGGLTIIVGQIVVPLLIQFGSIFKRSFRRVQTIDH